MQAMVVLVGGITTLLDRIMTATGKGLSCRILEISSPGIRLHHGINHDRRGLHQRSAKRVAFMSQRKRGHTEFFCLDDCAAESAPSRSEKFELQLAGLGRKKIVFGSRDNAVQVKGKLEQAYPKLDKGGGFEILRTGMSTSVRGLCVLNRAQKRMGGETPARLLSDV